MNDSKAERVAIAHEILDEIVDKFVNEEKGRLEKKGIKARKIEIKTRLARAIGLGNGADSDDAALKALYRLCSGESALSIERAVLISQETGDLRLIEWCAFRTGLITTPRVAIADLDALDAEDVFAQIVTLQQETSALVALLTTVYQNKPSEDTIGAVESAHRNVSLTLEKSTLLLIRFMERMLKGAAGK